MDREMLEKPFNKEQIKQRKGNFGDMIDYVETHAVITRLNEAFDGQWSFEIVSQETTNTEVIVSGKLTAEGISKMQFGSNKISLSKQGEIISVGDDWKAAASDCLKKCASLWGVGLHLYGGAEKATQPQDNAGKDAGKGMADKSQPKGGTAITKEQLAQIKQLRTKIGWTPEQVQDKTKEMFGTEKVETLNPTMATAFISYLQNQGNGKGVDY
jgi:hypothetical protein